MSTQVAMLYAGSELDDANQRMKWFDADTKPLDASTDSRLKLARSVPPLLKQLEAAADARDGALSKLSPPQMQAMIAWTDVQQLPDYPNATARCGPLLVTCGAGRGTA